MPDGRARSDGQLRVVQLNAGSLLEPRWPERRVEVVEWLERLQPDVVCLEEIHEGPSAPNTAGWIVDQLEDGWHWSFGGDGFAPEVWPEPELRFGSAILSRWPIERSGYRRLPLAPGAEGFLTAVPWELVHVHTAGLDVFACHLAAAPQDGLHRRAQVLEIDRYVREVRGDLDAPPAGVGHTRSAMPAILCGDFNAEPESDEIRFLSSLTALDGRTTFWQDAWRVAGDGPGLTQDWRTNPIAAALNVHRKRIDYVFVGDPFLRDGGAGRVLAAEVAFDEPLTGVLASDHAGLVVDVAWPGRPPLP